MKNIVFLTGTRADYGKIKQLIKLISKEKEFKVYIFVTGMHLLPMYGCTYREIVKDGFKNIYLANENRNFDKMDMSLVNTIEQFSAYCKNIKPDLIVIHGDRLEALAGAIVGAFNNIKVAHIEGGEVSGTIDESIRHAVSKFAHLHFVANEEAAKRLMQLGEDENYIFKIGSPDIDIMLSDELPDIKTVQKQYDIKVNEYAIFMYHPVTTESDKISNHIKEVTSALVDSDKNYIAIYPNNDLGSAQIITEIEKLRGNNRFYIYPSIRFESFLTMLKNAQLIIGNSSAGVREACIYGIPSIDIGTRQSGRYNLKKQTNMQHVSEVKDEIVQAIESANKFRSKCMSFGDGNSARRFLDILKEDKIWNINIQKKFIDLEW